MFACNDRGTEIKSWDVRQKIGSFALRQDGEGAVVALQHGVHLLDFASGELQLLHHPEADKPHNRLNDGKVDRQGRFLFGSMDMREQEPSGVLYRLDGDLSLHVLKEGIIVSNAPCWSPGGETFYFADTWSGEIHAWDYDQASGNLSGERLFCKVDRSEGGAADGATVDSEGCLWNALVYAGKLVRYTPDGKVDRIIDMPVKKSPASCLAARTSMCSMLPRWRNPLCHVSLRTISFAAACSLFTDWGDRHRRTSFYRLSEYSVTPSK